MPLYRHNVYHCTKHSQNIMETDSNQIQNHNGHNAKQHLKQSDLKNSKSFVGYFFTKYCSPVCKNGNNWNLKKKKKIITVYIFAHVVDWVSCYQLFLIEVYWVLIKLCKIMRISAHYSPGNWLYTKSKLPHSSYLLWGLTLNVRFTA